MKKIISFLVVSCSIFYGCSLNINPEDVYSDPDAITSIDAARSLLASAYTQYPSIELEMTLLSDDFCPSSLAGKDMDQLNFYRWQDKAFINFSATTWSSFYTTIATCDILLERIPNVVTRTDDENNKLETIKGEALTLKALCYFNLIRLFAPAYDTNPSADGVIIKDKVGYAIPSRSDLKTCVGYIDSLLEESIPLFHGTASNGWLSKEAAEYLSAELALYSGNYEEAAVTAISLINAHKDCLPESEGEYQQLWLSESVKYRIFAFYTTSTVYNSLQYDEVKGDYYVVNPDIKYSDNDIRKSSAIIQSEIEGNECNVFGKYNKNIREGRETRYINTMRYAGAYFIASEALYRQKGHDTESRNLINEYLDKCGADVIDASVSGTQLLSEILKEKQKEFLGEGVSYFDAKRTHAASYKRLSTWGNSVYKSVTPDDYRWTLPIPASEYKYNDNVTQNEEWPINR